MSKALNYLQDWALLKQETRTTERKRERKCVCVVFHVVVCAADEQLLHQHNFLYIAQKNLTTICGSRDWFFARNKLKTDFKKSVDGSVDSSAPTSSSPGFESQAHHPCFFQYVLLKLSKINEKEAGICIHFNLKKVSNFDLCKRLDDWKGWR